MKNASSPDMLRSARQPNHPLQHHGGCVRWALNSLVAIHMRPHRRALRSPPPRAHGFSVAACVITLHAVDPVEVEKPKSAC